MIEIIIHGKAGHGAKSLGEILAEILVKKGYKAQSFPEYSAARQGAPVRAFIRASREPILLHSNIEKPNIVVIISPYLITKDRIPKNSTAILNTKQKVKIKDAKIYTINATEIAGRHTGSTIANIAMLGSIVKATKLFTLNDTMSIIRERFERKLTKELLEKNIEAMKECHQKTKKQ